MNDSIKKIGFVGIGMMGYPMASLLYNADYQLTIFDVDPSQTATFRKAHPTATVVDELSQFADAEVVITMLPDSDIVDGVVLGGDESAGLIDSLGASATVIDMSSSQPLRSRHLAAELAHRDLHFLDAPVSGGVTRAIDGTLAIMVGGNADIVEQHRHIFAQLGKTITHVGAAGAGHAMKALNNYVSAAGLVAMVEALLVGDAFGLDQSVMVDVLNSSTGRNNTTENKAKQFMLSGNFDSNFALRLMAKDLGIAAQLGESMAVDMALAERVHELWVQGAETLGAEADHTEMYRFLQTRKERPLTLPSQE